MRITSKNSENYSHSNLRSWNEENERSPMILCTPWRGWKCALPFTHCLSTINPCPTWLHDTGRHDRCGNTSIVQWNPCRVSLVLSTIWSQVGLHCVTFFMIWAHPHILHHTWHQINLDNVLKFSAKWGWTNHIWICLFLVEECKASVLSPQDLLGEIN